MVAPGRGPGGSFVKRVGVSSAALVVCGVLFAAGAQAQTTIAKPSAAPADKPVIAPAPAWVQLNPAAKALTDTSSGPVRELFDDMQLRFGDQADEIYLHRSVQVITAQGLVVGNLTFPWNPDTDTLIIHDIRIVRGGETIDVLKNHALTVLRRENNLERSMLDGSLTAAIQIEDLQVGDVLDYAYTIRRHDPTLQNHSEFLGHLESGGSNDRAFARIVWPQDKAVRWYHTKDLPDPKVTKTADGAELIYDLKDVKPLKFAPYAPVRYLIKGTVEFSEFADWAEVSSVMAPLYAKAEVIGPNSPLKAEAAKIAASTTDPKARAQAALSLVQNRIRYLYLGMNFGAYTPADADVTWTRKFGDCKAKTVVLLALLKELGIEAEPAFVATRLGDGTDERLPAMESFDHVIVRAQIETKTYWLDGTRLGDGPIDQIQPPDYVWALPVQPAGARLEKIAVPPLDRPLLETSARIDARGGLGLATIHVEETFRGDPAYGMKLLFDAAPAEKRDDGLKSMLAPTGYSGVMVNKVTGGWNEAKREFTVVADGSAPMDWQRLARGQPLRFQTDVGQIGDVFSAKREDPEDKDVPFALGFPRYERSTETIILPRGGQGFSLNGAGDVQTTLSGVEYGRKVRLDKDTVTVETTARGLVSEISAAQAQADHNKLRDLHDDVVYIQGPTFWRDSDAEITFALSATPYPSSIIWIAPKRAAVWVNTTRRWPTSREAIKQKPDPLIR